MASVVLPDPVGPIRAIVRPAGTSSVDVLEDGATRVVPERHVLEHDVPGTGWQRHRIAAVEDLLRLVEDLEDPLAGCDRALRLSDPHAQHAKRHDEHREQEIEGGEGTERHRSRDDHPAADEEHERLRDERQEREQRDEERPLPVRGERLREDGVGGITEALGAASLLRERLDDVHAGDRLLRDDRDLRERLLNVAEDGVRDAAVAEGGERDQRRDRQRDERQLPAVEEEDGGDDDDRQDVLGEEDEPVAEEEAHRLEVDRRA